MLVSNRLTTIQIIQLVFAKTSARRMRKRWSGINAFERILPFPLSLSKTFQSRYLYEPWRIKNNVNKNRSSSSRGIIIIERIAGSPLVSNREDRLCSRWNWYFGCTCRNTIIQRIAGPSRASWHRWRGFDQPAVNKGEGCGSVKHVPNRFHIGSKPIFVAIRDPVSVRTEMDSGGQFCGGTEEEREGRAFRDATLWPRRIF